MCGNRNSAVLNRNSHKHDYVLSIITIISVAEPEPIGAQVYQLEPIKNFIFSRRDQLFFNNFFIILFYNTFFIKHLLYGTVIFFKWYHIFLYWTLYNTGYRTFLYGIFYTGLYL